MSLEYINKAEHMHIECDICPSEDEFAGTFEDCIDQAKGDGWKIRYHQGEWYHFCPDGCLAKL